MAGGLRIAFLDSWKTQPHEGSGTAVSIHTLARGLGALGHQVEFLRPRSRPPTDCPRRFLEHRLRFNMTLPERLDGQGPWDLVVGFDLDGVFLPSLPHRPLVVSLKGVAADEARFETGGDRALLEALARFEARNAARAHQVVVPSHYSADAARRFYSVPDAQLSVVPEALDLEPWQEIGNSRESAPDSPPVLLSVARQYPRKDTATLLRAMHLLVDRWPGLHLRVIGGGPELPKLQELVRQLGLQSRVTLDGAVSRAETIRAAYRDAHLFVLPSRQEGFGIVFLEAMAAGLPVVAARAGATPEVVQDGETGLLVPPGDPDPLARAIHSLLLAPGRQRTMSRAGRRRSREYAPPRVAHLFLQRTLSPLPHPLEPQHG